jgi:hypothetical protein
LRHTHISIIDFRLHIDSLRELVDLVGALKHLHDLLHDLRLHTLGLLELLAVAVDNSGGSLGNTEVRLVQYVSCGSEA